MAKLSAIFIATIGLLAGVQAQCPANTRLCGGEIMDVYGCMTEMDLTFITPAGNRPEDCNYLTDENGGPQGRGVSCCSATRCNPAGPGGQPPAFCD